MMYINAYSEILDFLNLLYSSGDVFLKTLEFY